MEMTYELYARNFTKLGPNDCWPWKSSSRDKNGYGIISWRHNGKHYTVRAHRWAFNYHNEVPLTSDEVVRHTCDNPPCQNPNHWVRGTIADNNNDCRSRGRDRYASGESHYRAKLTEVQVADIRRRYSAGGISQQALADEYGVMREAISKITLGKRWA